MFGAKEKAPGSSSYAELETIQSSTFTVSMVLTMTSKIIFCVVKSRRQAHAKFAVSIAGIFGAN
jgi:hypothetical protein